ncbi:MAG: hypothetical protein ACM3VT_10190 [Solirubrobacterales bacterium]
MLFKQKTGFWRQVVSIRAEYVHAKTYEILEDRYLCEHLVGYVGYAERVRYRLLPGVW